LPIVAEAHQIEFTVKSFKNSKVGRFVASCTRALSSVSADGFFDGIELTHNGKKAGLLDVQMAWQMVLNSEVAASILSRDVQ